MIHRVTIPEDPGVRAAFTSREPGNLSLVVGEGDVARARVEALQTIGATLDTTVFMQQVHGGAVARVDQTDRGRGARSHGEAVSAVDALVTTTDDVALAVMVADCVPVLLCDPGNGVGAVHAGRRGVIGEVVARAVAALSHDPSSVVAVIGPAIGGCCYEVPAEMAEAVTALIPAAKGTTAWGTPSLDLPAAVASQLADAGVARVEHVGGCTHCDAGRYFSHRAAAQGRIAGRQAGVIVRTSRDARTGTNRPGPEGADL